MDILEWVLVIQSLAFAGFLLRNNVYRDGVMRVIVGDDGKYIYSLVLEHDPEALRKRKRIIFKVTQDSDISS